MKYECCEGVRNVKISRRYFLKQGGVAMVGLSAMPAFLQRAVAATPMPNKKQLVVLFQRGAADGLNIVVPFGEQNYYRLRPSIAIPQPKRGGNDPSAIDLDGGGENLNGLGLCGTQKPAAQPRRRMMPNAGAPC